MTIIEDKAQQEGKHELKHAYWEKEGIEMLRYPLPVGDYILMSEKVADVIHRKDSRNANIKKMDFMGSYNITVDSKKDIDELCTNICGPEHARFRDECILAQNNGIKLIVLVENKAEVISRDGRVFNPFIEKLDDLHRWINPRLMIRMGNGMLKYPKATRGVTLMKAAMSMEHKYGVKFVFCQPKDAGKRIMELLGGDNDDL